MNTIKVTVMAFVIGMLFACSSDKLLNQDYYYISKYEVRLVKQVDDSIQYYDCKAFKKCDSLPNYSLRVLKHSFINDSTKLASVRGRNPIYKEFKLYEQDITLTYSKNGVLAFRDAPDSTKKQKEQAVYFYSSSKLGSLRPISEMDKAELDEILQQIIPYSKSLKSKQVENYDQKIRKRYTDLVIEKGYNPISNEKEMSFRPRSY
jgi:hypothetical protein